MLIYKATFPNQKSYIGKTTKLFERRKKEHLKDSSSKRECFKNIIFYKAIRKYGWDNIKWEILEDNITDETILNEKETFYILKYDTFMENGYNMTSGGDGHSGYKLSEETKQKMSDRFKNIPLTEETKRKMKENHTDFNGNKNPFFGKHHTEKTKHILKEKNSGKNAYNYNRKFTQEHIDKITKHHIGRKRSEETRRKISEAKLAYYKRKSIINTIE